MTGRIPLTFLTGFLGAGKTTLLNRVLATEHGQRVAVIVNEFGDVGVDGRLVVGARDELVELANGCLCCTVREDLRETLSTLLRKRRRRFRPARFDRVLIEASGMASPGPALQTVLLDEELSQGYGPAGVVATTCAPELPRELERYPEAGEQLAYADLVLLNHADRADEAALEAAERAVRACNQAAEVARTVRAELPVERLFEDRSALERRAPSSVAAHTCGVGTVVLRGGGLVDPAALRVWLGFLGQRRTMEVMRLKGFVRTAGGTLAVHGVHQWLELAPHDVAEGTQEESVLVVIGRGLDRAELERGWAAVVCE